MANDIFNVAFMDFYTGKAMNAVGGTLQVCVAGTYHKATLLDPLNGFVSLANPVTIKNGVATFAIAITGGVPMTCDIYGLTSNAHSFSRTTVKPGDPTEVWLDSNQRSDVLLLPWSIADVTAGTEYSTGFLMPNGVLVDPTPVVNIVTAAGQGSKTLSVGLLSTGNGGNATGWLNAASLTTAGYFKGTMASGGVTMGGLLFVTDAAASTVPEGGLIKSTDTIAGNIISYTITSGTTLAEGLFGIEYQMILPPPNLP